MRRVKAKKKEDEDKEGEKNRDREFLVGSEKDSYNDIFRQLKGNHSETL